MTLEVRAFAPATVANLAAGFDVLGLAIDGPGDTVTARVVPGSGVRIGQIRLPEICSNLCFGGTKRNRLFMTASQSLYAVYVETRGAHIT